MKFVAGRVGAGLPTSVDPGDLVSAGVFGLIDAVERFDPERGVKFETFAVPRIRGAIFDGLRSLDWVPRSVRSRAREVERAFTELEAATAERRPTTSSPTHLGITGTSSASGCRRSRRPRSARSTGPSTGPEPGRSAARCPIVPSAVVEEREVPRPDARRGRQAARAGEARAVAVLRRGPDPRQIGGVLGVTESRVSQIHSKAVLHLRARLGAAGVAH